VLLLKTKLIGGAVFKQPVILIFDINLK